MFLLTLKGILQSWHQAMKMEVCQHFLRTLLPPLQLPVALQHVHPRNVHKCCGWSSKTFRSKKCLHALAWRATPCVLASNKPWAPASTDMNIRLRGWEGTNNSTHQSSPIRTLKKNKFIFSMPIYLSNFLYISSPLLIDDWLFAVPGGYRGIPPSTPSRRFGSPPRLSTSPCVVWKVVWLDLRLVNVKHFMNNILGTVTAWICWKIHNLSLNMPDNLNIHGRCWWNIFKVLKIWWYW